MFVLIVGLVLLNMRLARTRRTGEDLLS
jgi:hypothetical protein